MSRFRDDRRAQGRQGERQKWTGHTCCLTSVDKSPRMGPRLLISVSLRMTHSISSRSDSSSAFQCSVLFSNRFLMGRNRILLISFFCTASGQHSDTTAGIVLRYCRLIPIIDEGQQFLYNNPIHRCVTFLHLSRSLLVYRCQLMASLFVTVYWFWRKVTMGCLTSCWSRASLVQHGLT